ncbi:MAG: chalcone isomerase family protein [Kiritimatiellales bacterium]|nr:chalcone isomerase family protein [Kiritimatiellales bacterium]
MTKRLMLLVLGALVVGAQGKEIAKVEMPDTLKTGKAELKLNGAGVRKKFFMDMYVGGLYLMQSGSDAAAIIKGDEPMAIRLHIVSGLITSEKMENATREGFTNATGGNTAAIQKLIEEFIAVFKAEIKKGDVYEMVYLPGQGTAVSKNGKPACTIAGMNFKQALFGIWLCDKPAQQSLKKEMLGE